jgi:hypothetical protein
LEVFFDLKPIENSTNPQANLVSASQPPFLSLGSSDNLVEFPFGSR